MSIGGSAAQSSTASQDTNFGSDMAAGKGGSFSNQDIYSGQQPYLDQAYGMVGQGANGAQQGVNNFLGNQGYTGQIQQGVNNLAGMSDPQALIDAQTASLQSGLQDTFAQGKSTIGSNAANTGAFGGARHGIQEAALGGELAQAYTQGHGDIVANARNQALNANNSAIAGANMGFNQGLQGELARMMPGAQYLQSLGGPTILGNSGSYDANIGLGNNFGGSVAQGSDESAKFGFGLK